MLEPTGHKQTLRRRLLNIRDDMVNYCQPFWKEIESQNRIYNNDSPHDMGEHMGQVHNIVRGKMLLPKIPEAIDKIHPRLDQGMPRAKYLPEDENLKREDAESQFAATDSLQNYADMYSFADNEQGMHSEAALWVLECGQMVRKVRWNSWQDRLEAPTISPLRFMVDSCSRIDLLDAWYCGQWDVQRGAEIGMNYPDYMPRRLPLPNDQHHRRNEGFRVDEIWIRKEIAESQLGVPAKRMVRAVLVNDNIAKMTHSPWNYPDFPYVSWRHFLRTNDKGKSVEFWGAGLPKKFWRQQQVLDNAVAKLLIQIGNQASGQMVTPYGAFDDVNQLNSQDAFIFELGEHFEGGVGDILELRPTQVSPALMQFVTFMVDTIEQISGVTDVFTGQEPAGNLSGRAISALQAAAFTQISNLIRDMVEYRRRLARIKAVLIQQLARHPLDPNQWRGGVSIKHDFPNDARHTGYRIEIHDTSLLPQTPAGKLQLAQILAQFGLTIEKFLEITGIDRSYGVEATDFQPQIQPGAVAPNENVLAGREQQAA